MAPVRGRLRRSPVGGPALSPEAHIDTVVLRALIDERDPVEMKEHARELIYHRNADPMGVSHITIGEAFHGIARDRGRDSDRVMAKFVELMVEQNRLSLYGVRDLGRYRAIIGRLEEEDFELRPCDCLILAAALLDDDCRRFYSADPDFISSSRLEAFCRSGAYRTRIVSWD